jgi:hypothetical protein
MESCLSSLSALESKIRVEIQNNIPFQRMKPVFNGWLHIVAKMNFGVYNSKELIMCHVSIYSAT